MAAPDVVRISEPYAEGGSIHRRGLRPQPGVVVPDVERLELQVPAAGEPGGEEVQVGADRVAVDRAGLALSGLMVRHLVMPGCVEDASAIMRFVAGLSPDTYTNVMDQYRPDWKVPGNERYGYSPSITNVMLAKAGRGQLSPGVVGISRAANFMQPRWD
jgi:hypothetical protein